MAPLPDPGNQGQPPVGEWLEDMALEMIAGDERCIAAQRTRRSMTDDERDTQVGSLER